MDMVDTKQFILILTNGEHYYYDALVDATCADVRSDITESWKNGWAVVVNNEAARAEFLVNPEHVSAYVLVERDD